MLELLDFELNEIRLGNNLVEGILTQLIVDSQVRFDSQAIDGLSGKVKTPQGFEDANIIAKLALLTDEKSTAYEKLSRVQSLFTGVDAQANPQVFEVYNKHLEARNIRHLVFCKLSSSENEMFDSIECRLFFTEHKPPIIRLEKEIAKSPTAQNLAKLALQTLASVIKKPKLEI